MKSSGPIYPVLMPVLNNADQTAVAIQDVVDQTIADHLRLLLVDQGSDDRTREMLWGYAQMHERQVRLWRHDPPLPSLAATWNRGLQWAWEAGAESCLVVNNDVRLPRHLYDDLRMVMYDTGAWFVTAVNVGAAWYPGMMQQSQAITDSLLQSRGGPDFSCFLIHRDCHRWFQFDEGFQPAYFDDNDYHRRLQLAGFGDKIFSVPIPYLHYGSGTLKDPANQTLRAGWDAKFAHTRDYYIRKWGGPVGQETYTTPQNEKAFNSPGRDPRWLLIGQGRCELGLKEYTEKGTELYGQAAL